MADLDDVSAMKDLDGSGVYDSIKLLADQARQAWEEIGEIEFGKRYKRAGNIVVSGMGGSSIGAHLVQSVYRDQLKVPLVLSNSYSLPGFVGHNSLVVLSSYSGDTEEVLASAEDAKRRGALVVGITTGGELAAFLRNEGAPGYIFDPKHNPAGQPRLAMGYSVAGQVALFAKMGYLNIDDEEIERVFALLESGEKKYGMEVPLERNPAKELAERAFGRAPVLVASQHLEGAVHVFANQLNESSKSWSDFRIVPELNHHLMEGLSHPKFLEKGLVFVFFRSKLYKGRIRVRFELTREVVEKNKIEAVEVELKEESALAQAFELVSLASFTNYYLAMKYGVDPEPIPWVNYFKKRLKQRFS